jgi:chromosome segregation ATPase
MSEPISYLGIGFLLAALLIFGIQGLSRLRWRGLAARHPSAMPDVLADMEADMGELHAQIAVATHRLEASVAQIKLKTTGQLAEIGKSSDAIARLKAEFGERSVALDALAAREKALHTQLSATEAELAVKAAALAELDAKLAAEKAELGELMAFLDARDKLAEAESRHAAAMEDVRAQNRALEEQLGQSYDELIKLEQEMASMKRQVEATWANERMANAVLRERINDVAGEVVRVAHALEGLGSPIDTMLAGKASELAAALSAAGSAGANPLAIAAATEDSKGSLAYRIRSLQKRAARLASEHRA